MSRIKLFLVTLAVFAVGACAETKPKQSSGSSSSSGTSAASTPSPEFDVAGWSQKTDGAKQTYLFALQAMNNQIDLLNKSQASQGQFALVVTTNSRKIADAAKAYREALDQAGPVPVDQVELKDALHNLRVALVNEEQAYRTAAACKDIACVNASRPAVVAAAKQSGAALADMRSATSGAG